MKSLTELYRIGMGPSSSHTMGPRRAAEQFSQRTPSAARYQVTLQGSLAATGKGHLTDRAILDALPNDVRTDILWMPEPVPDFHPNGLLFVAFDEQDREIDRWHVFSVGGGALREQNREEDLLDVYTVNSAENLLRWAEQNGSPIWQLVMKRETEAGTDIEAHLRDVWSTMTAAIDRGLSCEDVLPGPLHFRRRAHAAFARSHQLLDKRTARISAYALAVAEENGSGGIVVTAPTCGASGVIPGVFRYLMEEMRLKEEEIVRALATAGFFGNLIKQNASISGAEVGCQGEVGAACAMASAGVAQILGGTPRQVECAAEMGMEHHLGLTCDPMAGLVQIPCIERNAMAALRALDCAEYALLFDGEHRISFDQVVQTMNETGHDLPNLYRETSAGGLARWYVGDE